MSADQKINKDLKEERDKVTFEIEEFAKYYHGGAKQLHEKRFLGNRKLIRFNCQTLTSNYSVENYILSDPDLQSDVDSSYLSHKEKYEEAIRRVVVILKRIDKLKSEGHHIDDIHK